MTGRNELELMRVAKEIEIIHRNQEVIYRVADACIENECKAVVDFTINTFGKLDVLILTAGVSAQGYFRDLPNEVFSKMIDVNFMGYVAMT